MEKEKNWGTLFNMQHFKGRRACWSSRMGLGRSHKPKFKMKLICTTKKKRQLVEVEWKWCDGLNKDNLKHKFYTTYNLCGKPPLPSL
jgi:hypothetical protein